MIHQEFISPMILEGKVCLVTGASRGIGRAIAEEFARAGADVAINFFSHAEEAEEVAANVRACGRRALLCQADVADCSAIEQIVSRVAQELGRIDIAVSNAGYSDRALFHEADLTQFHRTVDITMWGAFHLFRAAARQMVAQGKGGSIIGISSPHAFVPVPTSMAYNMAKAALDQMARTAAIELISHKIRVNLVHPGWIDTPGERKFSSDSEIAAAARSLPWGRLGTSEEVARTVLFLADPASDYITGSSLLIDGGITLPYHWGSVHKASDE
jgi:glucose 1-dehydrogenase